MNLRLIMFALLLTSTLALGADEPALFSTLTPGQTIPASFRIITLPKVAKNTFSIVANEGKTVLRIDSADSAGSIGIALSTAGRAVASSTLIWRWKVDRVLDSARGRARQMNAGAAVASGDVLLFLHADTRLPEQADVLITQALGSDKTSWGRFDVRLSGDQFMRVSTTRSIN